MIDELRAAGITDDCDVKELVKCRAAQLGKPYDGAQIEQAFTIADVRAGSPRFAPWGPRERRRR